MDNDNHTQLRGIGGWLLFFLLTFAVFTPLRATIEMLGEIRGSTDPDLVTGLWIFLGVYLVFTWAVTAWFVLVRKPSSVWLVIVVMWLEALGGATLLILEGAAGLAAMGAITAFVYPTIWTAYLLKSERVANTYRRGPSIDDAEETFA
ncbi:DUF2569 family protein [Sphingomonas sp.]|jgi:hypothetical protein|uniref:DUF2569 family protein n=1 Tax=Sphingomonas sp. TaxID=28214 RepID=UPI0017BEA700|nr:DUF2569 family protein [Sphingomonas sp.]MBA4763583.1 DUF2569 family protein [Sphingomonas sp.]